MKQKLILCLLALMCVIGMSFPVYALEVPAESDDLTGTIVIIHTNDTHARAIKTEGQAGFTAVSGLKKAYEDAGATVLLLDAGDTLHGLPIANLNQGENIVAILNAVGYDAITPGNHDFNYGAGRLAELSQMLDFPMISANIFNNETGELLFDSSIIIERDGFTFGIIGLATPETAYKTNPANVATVTFADPISYTQAEVDKLKAQDVDWIIVLGHIGVDASSVDRADVIAAAVDGIDIFIDGHSHTAMKNGQPLDPAVQLVEHGNTFIASTGEYMNHIGIIMITEDEITADLLAAGEGLPSDTAIDALVDALSAELDAALEEVVGQTAVFLDGERETNRKQETNLGDLTADAFRYATGADMAFTNGGGIRESIQIGDITVRDIVTTFPFGNIVVTKELTGAAIIAAMEHGVKGYPELAGAFPQVSGITFQIDPSQPAGSRVVNPMIGGQPIDPGAVYLVATNDVIAAGGDDYTMLADVPIANTFLAMDEIVIEYIQTMPVVTAGVEGRITLVEEEQVTEAGEAVAAPEEVVVTVGEENRDVPEIVVVQEGETDSLAGTYTVVAGDNLWKIAKNHTGSGENWSVIYEMNRDIIQDPNRIYIGQVLKIPQN